MDAGLAAVCGALAGAVATTGAAFAAGWWQRENSRLAVRAEHRKQRRQPREETYKNFISPISELRDLARSGEFLNGYFLDGQGRNYFTLSKSEEIAIKAQEIRQAWVDVSLAGSNGIAETATNMRLHAQKLSHHASLLAEIYTADTEDNDDRIRKHAKQFHLTGRMLSDSIEVFLSKARDVLDDDGVSKSI
ncbi:hypothetical protein [Streptomyces sp. BE133]|uniref:hypothetical protein n=1 Tax=Streptomyces sp. BE133 TaxID=3002523 RepID=UPI002E7A34E3|nr:hypothetical protein [Streptomyces sp. BE133]MEE1806949.1 hypothetical protein [Streptomyces sp. BE133]